MNLAEARRLKDQERDDAYSKAIVDVAKNKATLSGAAAGAAVVTFMFILPTLPILAWKLFWWACSL